MQIPTPPNSEEKYLYREQNKWPLYISGLISFFLLVTGMSLFIIQHPIFWAYSIFVVLLTFYLNVSYFIGLFGDGFDIVKHFGVLEKGRHFFPTVDIFLPSCGEDINILINTMVHVSMLDYPRENLKVYVLDDSKDPEHSAHLKKEAEDLGFTYISRPNKGELKKAGNIRYAFAQTKGEFFVIFDADFCPRYDMLREMLPYMVDEKIAIVQTPQYFSILESDPWIQKGAAYIQELFYRLIQVNRQKWNASICVGTCAMYRRSALEPHGGTAAIGYSEDVHTGFQAICDGYKIQYIPINLSKGVCPDSTIAFLVQQYRWATGSITLFSNPHFWKAPISKMAKMNYLSGMLYYMATSAGLIFVPIPGLVMLAFFPEKIVYYNVIFSIPSFLYGTCAIALWSKAKWGLYAMQARQLSYWAYFLAIIDKFKNQTIAWVATGDKNIGSSTKEIHKRFYRWFMAWNITTISLSLALIGYRMATYPDPYNFAPALFLTLFNTLIFAITYSGFKQK